MGRPTLDIRVRTGARARTGPACHGTMHYGNVPGNPPSTNDHAWNPNATKIVIPISDEVRRTGIHHSRRTTTKRSKKHTIPATERESSPLGCTAEPMAVPPMSNPTSEIGPVPQRGRVDPAEELPRLNGRELRRRRSSVRIPIRHGRHELDGPADRGDGLHLHEQQP